MLKIPENIKKIICNLESNGYEAYIVGGAVRDALLNKKPGDYDIATSAPPEVITKLFEKTAPTGIAHGTVTVIVDEIPTEVTTYRSDGKYSNNRSPDNVCFLKNINEDLSRRDFTINAMAYNPKTGIIDLFDGKTDLNNKIIRTVGNPEIRFREDALRILRAVRFACNLNFKIEDNSKQAATEFSHLLGNISGERIYCELAKTLQSQNLTVLENFINSGGLNCINISSAKNLNLITKLPDNINLRIFSFIILTDCDFADFSKVLKISNKIKIYVENMLELYSTTCEYTRLNIKKAINLTSPDYLYDFLKFKHTVFDENTKNAECILNDILIKNEPYKISMLAINGNDITDMGFSGSDVGIILKALLKICIDNPNANTKEYLTEIIHSKYM